MESRPQSHTSGDARANGASPGMGEYLSPADADRPMPLPTTAAPKAVVPNGELPPGFVPSDGYGVIPEPSWGRYWMSSGDES
jgi:hypothetical protein